jgi:hypothetical protein
MLVLQYSDGNLKVSEYASPPRLAGSPDAVARKGTENSSRGLLLMPSGADPASVAGLWGSPTTRRTGPGSNVPRGGDAFGRDGLRP